MKIDTFVSIMDKQQKRITPVRNKMFGILSLTRSPITADFFVTKIGVNKTTVYRDLNLFLKVGLVQEIDFGDGIKRYELKELKHHHHLICIRCKRVQNICFDENLEWEEKNIKQHQKFQVLRHELEFFGYCNKCTHV